MNIVISLFIGAIVGFILGFLVFRNNADTFKEDEKNLLDIAKKFKKDDSGSIEVSPVSGGALIKYLLRFGVPLAGAFALVRILKPEMIETMLYKCCLVCVGYILAELIWVVGYKRTFDRQEKEGRITDVGRIAVLIFRGLLLSSVIVSLTMAL